MTVSPVVSTRGAAPTGPVNRLPLCSALLDDCRIPRRTLGIVAKTQIKHKPCDFPAQTLFSTPVQEHQGAGGGA